MSASSYQVLVISVSRRSVLPLSTYTYYSLGSGRQQRLTWADWEPKRQRLAHRRVLTLRARGGGGVAAVRGDLRGSRAAMPKLDPRSKHPLISYVQSSYPLPSSPVSIKDHFKVLPRITHQGQRQHCRHQPNLIYYERGLNHLRKDQPGG